MNRVEIHYCYATSERAGELGNRAGGFYVVVGLDLPISPLFKTIQGAEGFCRNHGLKWRPHGYPV